MQQLKQELLSAEKAKADIDEQNVVGAYDTHPPCIKQSSSLTLASLQKRMLAAEKARREEEVGTKRWCDCIYEIRILSCMHVLYQEVRKH